MNCKSPDFVKYAESYGTVGHRPTSDDNLRELFTNCLNMNGVHNIDLSVDYPMNHAILNILLKEKTCIL